MHKLTAEIPDELYDEMRRTIPWGLRRHLIITVLRLALDLCRERGDLAAGALIHGGKLNFRIHIEVDDVSSVPAQNLSNPRGS